MSGGRTTAAQLATAFAFLVWGLGGVRAEEVPQKPARFAGDVESTASVTLDRLSVKMLGVDRPWNPHICIGCDLNNGASSARRERDRAH